MQTLIALKSKLWVTTVIQPDFSLTSIIAATAWYHSLLTVALVTAFNTSAHDLINT